MQIEAFISPHVPESYVQTRLNLLTMLRELQALGGDKVQVQIHDTERYSNEAALAEKRYGIEPRADDGPRQPRRAMTEDSDLPERGRQLRPAEACRPCSSTAASPSSTNWSARSAPSASRSGRSWACSRTDAQLYGRFNMQTGSSGTDWPIIDELEKQYDVVQVDPTKPITEKVRRAAGRAAVVAWARGDGQLRRGGRKRPADGDLRGPLRRASPERSRHGGAENAAAA